MTNPSSQSSDRSTKKRFGMEKWSKEYNTKCKDLRKFNDDKKTLLKMLLATILFLRDIYFFWNGWRADISTNTLFGTM